ncbi:MAG: lipopolysaccharide transport periplasmic protein LptA [Candidatus Endonucleobacter bathymodioli]|uniref:Lipopolysaccharide export system protein LptA n=1 Tax=Candidatus Endonucleibacter bathymodioli TaxID=539814 RepID=A0AA90NSN8_9GAMM|nr:lipopolysaccharide transport periplasmic protein LptA [Candidatus Endonucleobacter bathymodioli]
MLIPGIVLALSEDRRKPVGIESDSASLDHKKGMSVFRGSVIMTQGTTQIKGDVVTIYNNKEREVTRVVAEGNRKRAYYAEQQEGVKGKLQAWGMTIDYNISEDQIVLLNEAEVSQGGDILKGERIEYDILQQSVRAIGKFVNDGSKGRVRMIIKPR